VLRDFEEARDWLAAQGRLDDPALRRRLADLAVQVVEVEMHALRVLDAMLRGRGSAVEAAASKVFQTEVCQAIARTALEFGGAAALADDARVNTLWRQSLWETIGGGTSEVMRGVVARRGLGLGGRA
jgi:alkylation response protein AidB-like acyl-CoA dehydrogenase